MSQSLRKRPIVIEHSLQPSVGLCVCRLCVCPVDCGKTADRIWMPFGVVGGMGPGIRQVVGLGIGPREGVILGQIWGIPL